MDLVFNLPSGSDDMSQEQILKTIERVLKSIENLQHDIRKLGREGSKILCDKLDNIKQTIGFTSTAVSHALYNANTVWHATKQFAMLSSRNFDAASWIQQLGDVSSAARTDYIRCFPSCKSAEQAIESILRRGNPNDAVKNVAIKELEESTKKIVGMATIVQFVFCAIHCMQTYWQMEETMQVLEEAREKHSKFGNEINRLRQELQRVHADVVLVIDDFTQKRTMRRSLPDIHADFREIYLNIESLKVQIEKEIGLVTQRKNVHETGIVSSAAGAISTGAFALVTLSNPVFAGLSLFQAVLVGMPVAYGVAGFKHYGQFKNCKEMLMALDSDLTRCKKLQETWKLHHGKFMDFFNNVFTRQGRTPRVEEVIPQLCRSCGTQSRSCGTQSHLARPIKNCLRSCSIL